MDCPVVATPFSEKIDEFRDPVLKIISICNFYVTRVLCGLERVFCVKIQIIVFEIQYRVLICTTNIMKYKQFNLLSDPYTCSSDTKQDVTKRRRSRTGK